MSIQRYPRRHSSSKREHASNSNYVFDLSPTTSNSLNPPVSTCTSEEIGVCDTGLVLDTTKVDGMKPEKQNESFILTSQPKRSKKATVTKAARVRVNKSKIASSPARCNEIYSGVPTDNFEYSWNGWTKKILQRKKGMTKGVKDSYWFSPNYNFCFRSLASIRRFWKIYEECQDEKQAWEKLTSSQNPKNKNEDEKKNVSLDTELEVKHSKQQETASNSAEALKIITTDEKTVGVLKNSIHSKRKHENKNKIVVSKLKAELSKQPKTPSKSKVTSKITNRKKSARTVKSTRVMTKKSKIVSPELGPKEIWSGEPTEKLEYAWEPGWTKKIFQRQSGKSSGLTDSYWYTPKFKYKLRSLAEIRRYMKFHEKFQDEEKAWNTLKGRLHSKPPNSGK